jgi:hypothetical protein
MMASSDWIEVQRLAAEFQRTQLSSTLQKYKYLYLNLSQVNPTRCSLSI